LGRKPKCFLFRKNKADSFKWKWCDSK
jgi:hypothetical protein